MIGPRASAIVALVLSLTPAPAMAAQRHLLLVTGLGGEKIYSDTFDAWAHGMRETATQVLGIAPAQVTLLANAADASAQARREHVLETLRRVARESAPGDLIMLMLIGHGTARNGRALFNLPGPDLSAEDLAQALKEFADRDVVVVIASSASGAFVPVLSAPGRVVITATAGGGENQHAYFGGHFVAAFSAATADGDKDGRISVLEAFHHARRAVARRYIEEDRLLTEHALLDDDGNGIGTRAPGTPGAAGAATQDGELAARLYLQPTLSESAPGGAANRVMVALEVQARELVTRVQRLKLRRERLTSDDYYAELEAILLALAHNRRELRALGQTDAAGAYDVN